ncbi:MAG: molybdate ABC transporter substrate-binding protein [Thermoanaerobaculia bacterium]
MRRAIFLAALVCTSIASAAEIRVFAAASLTDALREIGTAYERHSGDRVTFNFAASSTLARQLEEGAPADLFLSADEEKMDRLARRGLIVGTTRVSILSNTLVIVGTRNLLQARTIALAEPSRVPAGIYARQYLQKEGLWERVARKVVPTENVRGALAAVEAGNADAAIVYRTDALRSRRARIAYEVPRERGPHISYPFAMLRDAPQPAAAQRFLAYLRSKAALDVFARHGFLVR